MRAEDCGKHKHIKASAKPVQRRLLIPLTGVLLLLVGGFGVVLVNMQQRSLNRSSQQLLEGASNELDILLAEQSETLVILEQVLVNEEKLRDALKARDRQRLLGAYEHIFAQLREEHGITHFYFHRPDRVNLLRVHKPEKNGDLIDRLTAVEGDTQMFFAKRRWALRVIDGMGLPSSSPEATELVDMIIAGAKQFEEMVHSTGMRMNDAELVLMSVAAMSRNPTALNRLTQDAGLSVNEATQLLERARRAGRHLADENGYTEIVARHYDR